MAGLPSIITPAVENAQYKIDAALPLVSDVLLAVYNARADALAAANAAAISKRAQAAALKSDNDPGYSRSITLTLTKTATPLQPSQVRATSPGSIGTPPHTSPQAPTTTEQATITFDISPAATNGFAQSITEHSEAHQTIHQTAGGFYVDNYGTKPGDLTISAIVVFYGYAAAQIQVFKDLLYDAKAVTASLVTPPPRLLYSNSIDGRKLLLTQASLDVEQSADNPNQAVVTIKASILVDYSSPSAPQAPPTLFQDPTASSLAMVTSPTGAVTNNTQAVAGVAALA